PPPGFSNRVAQPLPVRKLGRIARTSIRAVLAKGFCAQNCRLQNAPSSAHRPPPAGTGIRARIAMLLSEGTSRHAGVGPRADGNPVAGSLLARSAEAVTLINMHSWPACTGVHSNGPMTTVWPGPSAGTGKDAVLIGSKSSGHTSPAL